MVFTFFLLRCSGRDGGGSSSYIIPIHMSHWMITPSFQTWSWDHLLRDMARISGKDDLICSASAWAWMSVPFWFGWRSTLDEPTLASMQALLPFDEMPVVSAKDSDSPASPPSALFTLFVRQKFRWRFNEAVASLLLYRLRFLCSSLFSGGGLPHACTDTQAPTSNRKMAQHPMLRQRFTVLCTYLALPKGTQRRFPAHTPPNVLWCMDPLRLEIFLFILLKLISL